MGWTAPATYSVNEIVTASKLNTHIRDNLAYLKGQAGAVAIEDAVTAAGMITAVDAFNVTSDGSSAAVNIDSYRASAFGSRVLFRSARGTLGSPTQSLLGDLIGRFGAAGRTNAGAFGSEVGRMDFVTSEAHTASAQGTDIQFATTPVGSTTAVPVARITGSGRLGIGSAVAAAPQGPLHAAGVGGNVLFVSVDAVNNTLQTPVIAGTVTQSAAFWLYDRNNTGGAFVQISGNMLALNQTFGIANTDTITVAVTSGGAITVQRTSGTNGTHQVNMLVLYK